MDDEPELLGAEQKQAGSLDWRVCQTYWLSVGGVLASSILMSLLLMQGRADGSDLLLPVTITITTVIIQRQLFIFYIRSY